MSTVYSQTALETFHEDMVHDAQLDYYGKRLATCSSDRSIKIFEIDGENRREIETLKGHDGPVWQVAWAHPKFGNILASCSYDSKVIIWKEQKGSWKKIKEYTGHTASVNSVSWAPHELGPILACASSDGKISVLTFKDDGTWDARTFDAHTIGANSVSWAPATIPGALVQITGGSPNVNVTKRFASAGCDNSIKIWAYREDTNEWREEDTLEGHTDWVRDVAWAPNIGLPKSYLASCSQDKTVFIWTQDTPTSSWNKKPLRSEKFLDVVWRVSWSLSGNVLAVACGDNKVTLWKENLKGEWELLSDLVEQ
ncbi:WD40 repeat-like protein [Gigaspora rosea]|uniref:WD40 repeat-like protein n=1 Tax=Gigaspora rosea TaxID=44941 RepID=A0A397UIJ9_9GLOM|nr:WD40 repeat-like protein [Gigaspora rosea]